MHVYHPKWEVFVRSKKVDQQEPLQAECGERGSRDLANRKKDSVEAADVSKPVKHAVGLSVDDVGIQI